MFNLDEEQTSLKALTTDTCDSLNKINSLENIRQESFKLVEGKNDPITFLPLNLNIGGQITPCNKYEYKESIYLTEEQATHIYKKVECNNIINSSNLKQDIEQDQELSKLDNTSGDINPYTELIGNNAEKIDTV